jgi:hypothetical protein
MAHLLIASRANPPSLPPSLSEMKPMSCKTWGEPDQEVVPVESSRVLGDLLSENFASVRLGIWS